MLINDYDIFVVALLDLYCHCVHACRVNAY